MYSNRRLTRSQAKLLQTAENNATIQMIATTNIPLERKRTQPEVVISTVALANRRITRSKSTIALEDIVIPSKKKKHKL